jgi:cytochrome c-type biogenesis protein CcmH/NrfG
MIMDIEQTYQLGYQMRCDGRYGEAKQVFDRVLMTDPGHVDARHQLALISGFQGEFDASLEALAKLSKEVPGNLTVRYDLAMTQMMLGMYEEACANLKMILKVDPTHEKALQQIVYC